MSIRINSVLVLLSLLTSQIASADCFTAMNVRVQKLSGVTDRNAQLAVVGKAGLVVGTFAIIAAPIVGVAIFTAGFGAAIVPGMAHEMSQQEDKLRDLSDILLYVRGMSSSGAETYEVLRDRVQKKNPNISDDEIRSAVMLSDRDESLCPGNRAVSMKRMAKIIAQTITGFDAQESAI